MSEEGGEKKEKYGKDTFVQEIRKEELSAY